MNGSWIDVFVNINSHCHILRLLLHNVLDYVIFSECVHDENSGPDMKDEDYSVLVVPLTSVEEDYDNGVINSYNSIAETIKYRRIGF